MKTVKFGEKASSKKNRYLDSWVQNREIITKEPTKRLTIVIPFVSAYANQGYVRVGGPLDGRCYP